MEKKVLIKKGLISVTFCALIFLASFLLFGGCGERRTTYSVTINPEISGMVSTNNSVYEANEQVIVTINAPEYYVVDRIYYIIEGQDVEHTVAQAFGMPAGNIELFVDFSYRDMYSSANESLGHVDTTEPGTQVVTVEENVYFVGWRDLSSKTYSYLNLVDTYYLRFIEEYVPGVTITSPFRDYKTGMLSLERYEEIKADLENKLNIGYDEYYEKALVYLDEMYNREFAFKLSGSMRMEAVFNRVSDVSAFTSNGATYVIYNTANVAILSGTDNTATNVTVPERINGANVIALIPSYPYLNHLSEYPSSFSSALTSLTLPNAITSILPYTFHGLPNLTSFTAPAVNTVGAGAFQHTGLANLDLADFVLYIGDEAFLDTNVKELTLTNPRLLSTNTDATSLGGLMAILDTLHLSNYYNNSYVDGNFYLVQDSTGWITANRIKFVYNRDDSGSVYTTASPPVNSAWQLNYTSNVSNAVFGYWKYSPDDSAQHSLDDLIECSNFTDPNNPTIYVYLGLSDSVDINGQRLQLNFGIGTARLLNGNSQPITNEILYNGETFVVTEICTNAYENSTLTNITIPATVQIIGVRAFYNSALQNIIFEDNSQLKIIENGAFEGTNLTQIALPATLKTIGNSAFRNSTLQIVTFANNSQLKSIGLQAFYGTALTQITFPDSLETIDNSAFSFIETLTSATFSAQSQLKSLGNSVFSHTAISEILLPSGLESMGTGAFSSCDNLTNITIFSAEMLSFITLTNFENVSTIYMSSLVPFTPIYHTYLNNFYLCVDNTGDFYEYSLLDLVDPVNGTFNITSNLNESNQYILTFTFELDEVFADSYYLAGWSIGDSPDFYTTDATLTLTYSPDMATCYVANAGRLLTETIDGVTYSYREYDTTARITSGADATGDIILKSTISSTYTNRNYTVTEISAEAFRDNSAITSVVMPENLTTIDDYAFYNCTNLNSVTWGVADFTLGSYSFRNNDFTTLTLPENLVGTEHNSIYYSYVVDRVIIDSAVAAANILPTYFTYRDTLVYINADITELNSFYSRFIPRAPIELNGKTYNGWVYFSLYQDTECNFFYTEYEVTDEGFRLSTPNYYGNFLGWYNYLTDELISTEAEYFTADIYSVPNQIIGRYDYTTYTHTDGNSYLLLPDNVAVFNHYNGSATELVIPAEIVANEVIYIVKYIGMDAFYRFNSAPRVEKITIPASVGVIVESAFRGCPNLTTIIFESGSKLKYIANAAFNYCYALTEINLEDCTELTTLGHFAFVSCEDLHLILPESVTEIGSVSGLASLTINSYGAYQTTSSAFTPVVYVLSAIDDGSNASFLNNYKLVGTENGYHIYNRK